MKQENRSGQPDAERASAFETLGVPTADARHIAFGNGSRWSLPDGELEHYPASGVVRLTNLREGVQVTLVGQTEPPSMRPDGLVFAQPGSDRWLSVGNDGSATLFVGSTTSPAAEIHAPPADRFVPSPARPIVQADAAPARQRESKEHARGRIEGILVYDPVFTVSSQKQKELVRFTVAEHYTNADGNPQTVYHRCVAFNSERKRLADQVRDHAKQGDAIIVHGNWHDVEIRYRNGSTQQERQLWAYGLKITSPAAR